MAAVINCGIIINEPAVVLPYLVVTSCYSTIGLNVFTQDTKYSKAALPLVGAN